MSNVSTIMGMASQKPLPPSFAGSNSSSSANGGSVVFYSVNGDYDTLEAGDFVVAIHSAGVNTTVVSSMTCANLTSNGVDEVAALYANDKYDTNLKVYAGTLTTRPNSITFSDVGNISAGCAAIIMWFKNVASSESPATVTGTNTYYVTPPDANGLRPNDIVVCCGGDAHNNNLGSYNTPSDLTNFIDLIGADSNDTYAGMGIYVVPSGVTSFNPSQWITSSTTTTLTSGSFAAATIVLRAAQ